MLFCRLRRFSRSRTHTCDDRLGGRFENIGLGGLGEALTLNCLNVMLVAESFYRH